MDKILHKMKNNRKLKIVGENKTNSRLNITLNNMHKAL